MGSKSPVFPFPPPSHHFSDYGFDPQLDYFQVLEEGRRVQGKRGEGRAAEAVRFRLQKPISKEEQRAKSKKRRWYWWKSAALLFWKRDKPQPPPRAAAAHSHRAFSGPIYVADYGGPAATCRSTSGPLRFAAAGGVPYVSLRELNLVEGGRVSESDPAPIYLVT